MKVFILVCSGIAFLMAILLFVAPSTLVHTGEFVNREVESEDFIFSRRIIFGLFLVALGVVMLYLLYLRG